MSGITQDQWDSVRRLRNRSYGTDDILIELRLKWPGITREQVTAALREIAYGTAPRIKERLAPLRLGILDGKEPQVPRRVLAERAARRALEPRDLTAELMGDPLPGRSALDQRKAPAEGRA